MTAFTHTVSPFLSPPILLLLSLPLPPHTPISLPSPPPQIEVQCLIDMINMHIIPSMKAAAMPAHVKALEEAAAVCSKALAEMHHASDEATKASLARVLRLETMLSVREVCDKAEGVCPADLWTLATYKELLFLDQHE